MKNLKTLLTMAIVALMSLSFTSCDEDADIGDTLYGTWKRLYGYWIDVW